jgi:AcrR family transcriptional regulator
MQRMTGLERRAQILAIAAKEFARTGLHGTSAETIARRADISQPYIYRLFGTKKELFRLVVAEAFEEMTRGIVAAAGDLRGEAALAVMAEEYRRLLADRTRLLLQMQGFAACGDDAVRETVRAAFGRHWDAVAAITGLDPVRMKVYIALGMLLNDAAAMDLANVDTDWARASLDQVPVEFFR